MDWDDEQGGNEMKKVKVNILGIEIKARNKNEERMAWIFNDEVESIVKDWSTEKFWKDSFAERDFQHWRFLELSGQASALYFMEMIEEPLSSVEIRDRCWEAVKEQEAA